MDIEQMVEEGGHGVDPEVIRRAEHFLYHMKWKVCPDDLSVYGLDNELLIKKPGGLTLSASNNTINETSYAVFISFAPGGGMSVSVSFGGDEKSQKNNSEEA